MPLELSVQDLHGFSLQADHELRAVGEGDGRQVELRQGSWGGRAVRNLKVTFGEDRSAKQAGNMEVKGAVLKALSDAYGPEVAKRAFVAGAGHLNEAGNVESSSNHPLTGRQIEKMLRAAEREAAQGFVQDLKQALDGGANLEPGALGRFVREHVDAEAARRGIAPDEAARALGPLLIPMIVRDAGMPDGLAIKVAVELKRIAGEVAPERELPASEIHVAEAEDRFARLLRDDDSPDAPDDQAGRVVYALKRSFGDTDIDGDLQGWHLEQDGTRPAWEASERLTGALQSHARELREQDPEAFAKFHRALTVQMAGDPELPPALTVRLAGALNEVAREGEAGARERALAGRLGCEPEEVLRPVFGDAVDALPPEERRAALRDFSAIMDLSREEIGRSYGIDIAAIRGDESAVEKRMSIAGEMRTLAGREPPVEHATAAMLLQRMLVEAGLEPTPLPPDVDLHMLTGSRLGALPPAFDRQQQ